jgi:DNA invertase Pin-like site-specific DNA recombinase
LRLLVASANIERMTIPLRTIEPKPRSKFHGDYHRQMRQQAERRRIEAFRLYLEGLPVTEIADRIGVDHSTVWRYLHRELDASRLADSAKVDLIREQLLHRLYRIVNEAFAGFERSCRSGNTKTRVTERHAAQGKFREKLTEVDRDSGDPRFLQTALDAIREIRELFGLVSDESESAVGANAPIRIATCFGGENPTVENATTAIATTAEDAAPPGDVAATTGAESIVTPGEKGHSNAVAGKAPKDRG